MTNIVLFGPPGSGKGTQSKKLIEKYGFFHVSTGDLFRQHMEQGTPVGEQIKEIVNSGALVPDDITIAMLEETIQKNKTTTKGFLFDGFPRTHDQAVALDALMGQQQSAISAVIVLDVSEEELRRRISKRKNIEHRADDDEEKWNKRIDVFFKQTIHAFPVYERQGTLSTIDGMGDVEEIFVRICAIIDKYKS